MIGGPTASGKSALALAVAAAFDGVVVNADSMQIYRELPVLTATPSAAERAQVPHRLYEILAADDPCSAGRWLDLARAEIAEICAAGRLPVLVGGTGLYLQAAMRGIAPTPKIPTEIREAVRAKVAADGTDALHAALAMRDAEAARRIHPADSQRVARAWEVLEATGRSITEWQAERGTAPIAPRCLALTLLPPRAAVHAACEARFAAMLDTGAIDEVRQLLAGGLDPDLPLMKAVGVPEIASYLAGDIDRDTLVAQGQTATRRYAKRQIHMVPASDSGSFRV